MGMTFRERLRQFEDLIVYSQLLICIAPTIQQVITIDLAYILRKEFPM